MITVISYIIFGVYVCCLLLIGVYCTIQFHLLFHYLKKNAKRDDEIAVLKEEDYPFVTIQLPIFNEYFVVNRLIDNIVQMDYPKDKYEIQVLDD